MTALIHCRTAATFVDAVTGMLGYCPSDSLVILPLQGNSGGAVMRLDLPAARPPVTPAALDAYASTVLGLAMRLDGVTSIGCVVFTDEDAATAPRRDVVDAIARAADRNGLHLFLPTFRARNGWGRYDRDGAVEPLGGLPETGHLPLTAAPRAAAAAADAAEAALTFDPSAHRLRHDDDVEQMLDLLLDDESPRLHPDDVERTFVFLARALSYATVRDALLSNIAFGSVRCDDDWRFEDDWEYDYDADELLLPGSPNRERDAFDPDRCERAIPVLRGIARRAPLDVRPHVYAAIAWVYWALGHGTQASGWAQRALEAMPDVSLAGSVRLLVDSGMVAPWFGKAPRRARGGDSAGMPITGGDLEGWHPDAA